jgi:thymidylate kinase
MRLIVLEGDHSAGTSTHTEGLSNALKKKGFNTVTFHHRRYTVENPSPWARSLYYALQRAEFIRQHGATENLVALADRWYYSTEVLALTLPLPLRSRMIDLCHLEGNILPQPVMTVLLDAPPRFSTPE